MSKHYSQEQKKDIINRYFLGEGVDSLSEETGVSRSTIYSWIKVERQLRYKYNRIRQNSKKYKR